MVPEWKRIKILFFFYRVARMNKVKDTIERKKHTNLIETNTCKDYKWHRAFRKSYKYYTFINLTEFNNGHSRLAILKGEWKACQIY